MARHLLQAASSSRRLEIWAIGHERSGPGGRILDLLLLGGCPDANPAIFARPLCGAGRVWAYHLKQINKNKKISKILGYYDSPIIVLSYEFFLHYTGFFSIRAIFSSILKWRAAHIQEHGVA